MDNHTEPAIAVHALRKTFDRHTAVEEVTFSVARGRIVGLLGPNGAGKTTTMRILLGLMDPDVGTAHLDGRPYARLSSPTSVVGAVLDAGALHPGRTGREHVRIAAAMTGATRSRVDAVLDEVGMISSADRPISGYSLGMRQRLALATALLGEPSILILDEPANGLDPAGTRWLRDRLRTFATDGGSVLISSHVLAEISQIADDVVVVAQGRVVAAGGLTELTARFGGDLESYYLDLTSDTAGVR